ncbi:MAG: 30S ribosomal protein S8 [Candidatus Gastranaerophilales bacterium]|nr:30S ribosomal protein S8 [Candidatus Gastranaerophilales bacterium]
MTISDPIADTLTRIRNANMVKHESVSMPHSNLKEELIKVLQKEGYVGSYVVEEKDNFKFINLTLKYHNSQSVITGLKRVSKPGLRVYSKAKNMPRVFDGMGIAVISTSKGLMTEKEARANQLGGEVLCYVW